MPDFDRPQLTQVLDEGAQALRAGLDGGQIAQLMDFMALLVKWNSAYNLTAIREPGKIMTHHLLDSLAAVHAFAEADNVLDVGSGGGLPGIVLAIWAHKARPEMRISMIDTVQKKTAFLTQVKAELGLANVTVHTGRVEQLQADKLFDVITSRAFASLRDFVEWSGHLLDEAGCFMAMKGVVPEEEIATLPKGWAVTNIEPLVVPGLGAERHLIRIEKKPAV